MERPSPFSLKKSDLPWAVLSLLLLVPCLYYPYLNVTQTMDFSLNTRWKVLSVLPCARPERCLRVDDQVLAVGSITHEMYLADRTLSILEPFREDGVAPVRLLRQGREMTLTVYVREQSGKLGEIPPAAIFPL